MASKLRSAANGRATDTARIETFTSTIHNVHIDIATLLGAFDPTDQVVLWVDTPSGRPKRVTIAPGFLVAPHHEENPPGWD